MIRSIFRFFRWLPASLLAMLGISWILLICESAGNPPDFINRPKEGTTRGPEPRTGALLLNNGRLVEGRISESSTGYVVDFPNGSMLVPFAQVRLEGTNRRDAFHKYRDTIASPTATTHLALARWCIVNLLYDDAYSQLQLALKLEPENKDARDTLKRLDETLLSKSATAPAGEVKEGLGVKTAKAIREEDLPDVESIGGLSRNTAQEWTAHVQPLLINKCGNTSCHGGTENHGLQLNRVSLSQGLARAPAERNLASVAKYIDRGTPSNSRLLIVPRGNHGPKGRSIFVGQVGRTQYQILRRWVHLAARDLGPEAKPTRPAIGLGQQVSFTRSATQDASVNGQGSAVDASSKSGGGSVRKGKNGAVRNSGRASPRGVANRATATRNGATRRTERSRISKQPASASRNEPRPIPSGPARPLELDYEPTPALKAARDRQINQRIVRELRQHDKPQASKGVLPDQENFSPPLNDSTLKQPPAGTSLPEARRRIPERDLFDPEKFNSAP